MLKKIINISLWVLGIAGLMGLLAFSIYKEDKIKVQDIRVNVYNSTENEFVDELDIKKFLIDHDDSILGKSIASISLKNIEERLLTHPALAEANISTTIDGKVQVDVSQRVPLARIFNLDGENYYLDTRGTCMPLSDKYTARTIVFTGNIYEPFARRYLLSAKQYEAHEKLKEITMLDDIYNLAMFINSDSLLKNLVLQVNVNADKDFELQTIFTSHKVILGDAENLDQKFDRLKTFYKEGLSNANAWEKYSIVNLKFKDLIVCTKRNYVAPPVIKPAPVVVDTAKAVNPSPAVVVAKPEALKPVVANKPSANKTPVKTPSKPTSNKVKDKEKDKKKSSAAKKSNTNKDSKAKVKDKKASVKKP